MPPVKVFDSGAFRLALIFAAVFTVGVATLVAGFDAAVASYAERRTLGSLNDETRLIRQAAARLGEPAFAVFLRGRERSSAAEHFRYLLLDPAGRRLAGSLPPGVEETRQTTLSLPEAPEPDEAEAPGDAPEMGTVRMSRTELAGGERLVVGRDAFAMRDLTEWVNRLTLWTGVGVGLLALVGGYGLALVFLNRLERVDGAARRIMAGRLDERLPPLRLGAEFERLSTTLNAMLDRIEALMQNLRQVSTDIAHDLRTPLTRLRVTLEQAQPDASATERAAVREQALLQLEEVLATFDALLRIGQLEGGVGRVNFATVDLAQVMEQVHEAYLPAAEDAGRELLADLAEGVMVEGDARLLAQLFSNLVENALAHAGEGARIVMSLARTPIGALAAVTDDGPGVPAAERQKVLRRFHRLDASRSSPGAGLCLALAIATAELHGATLDLRDADPGLRVELAIPTTAPTEASWR